MAGGGTWVIADPHFFHANILNFKDKEGKPLRPFQSVEDMNETIVSNWNSLVADGDRVYVLGDVVFHNRYLYILDRLKGRKVLVKGNHDTLKLSQYAQYFDDIRAYVCKKGYILSHIPIHPGSLSRWNVNIHGHMHSNCVTIPNSWGADEIDSRYCCVSVEQTNYKPVELSNLLRELGVRP